MVVVNCLAVIRHEKTQVIQVDRKGVKVEKGEGRMDAGRWNKIFKVKLFEKKKRAEGNI